MSKDRENHTDALMSADNGGWMSNFLADEEDLDRRALWRLGSWGVGTVGVVIAGIVAAQSPAALYRDQLASADMAKQSQQVQWIAKESQNQSRQLAAAVETLNSDRDRLYARVTVLEQGLDSVTGSISKQSATATLPAIPVAPQTAPSTSPEAASIAVQPDPKTEMSPPPKIAPVASVASPPAQTVKPSEQKSEAAIPAEPRESPTGALAATESAAIDKPVKPTEFGVDLGSANSVEGLRALWRGVVKTNSAQLASLLPIIVVKERADGLGMQLRLVAGPLTDAAAAARICATLTEYKRACETSAYNGQRLALHGDQKSDGTAATTKQRVRPRAEKPAVPQPGSFSSIFGIR